MDDETYLFKIDPLTEEEVIYIHRNESISNEDKMKDPIFAKHLHNQSVEIWMNVSRLLNQAEPDTWAYELAKESLPIAEEMCRNFRKK